MNWIDNITEGNFNASFDIKKILANSTFYPASGIDATNIEALSEYTNSFVHVDYSVTEEKVRRAMSEDFQGVGYKLIGLKHLSKEELTPNGFKQNNFPLKDSEVERMENMTQARNIHSSFCYWAVYELNESSTGGSKKNKRFSLLHIGGEACATFDALYVNNGINSKAVAILNPGEGYGDNWTIFRDPGYRLFQLMKLNSEKNNAELPKCIFTNMTLEKECFWPGYKFENERMYCRPNGNWDRCMTFERAL